MSPRWYKLTDDKHVVPAKDINEWGESLGKHQRVAETTIGQYWISTVFLGIDHGFTDKGQPILFETMVFEESKAGKDRTGDDVWMRRCTTYEEALAMHQCAIDWVKAGAKSEDETTH